jgi:peptidoglycan/LPS O-acetylase OafA/YrhL
MIKKYYGIEVLRFISALSVVFFHYKVTFAWGAGFVDYKTLSINLPGYNSLSFLYNYGFYGVQIFFIISGFVFAHVYLKNENDITAKFFFINRFARLYPLHLLTLFIFVLYYFIDQSFVEIHFNSSTGSYLDIYHFFLNIFFIHSWGFEKGWSFNSPSWSISVEVAVYLSFFIILNYLNKYKIILASVIVLILFIFYKVDFLHFKYSEYVFLFYLGVTINLLNIEKKNKFFLFLSFFLLFFSFYGRNFKILLFSPSVLILAIAIDIYIKEFKYKYLLNILGNATYSIYLLHFPYMLIFLWAENKFFFLKNFYYNSFFIFFYFFSLIFLSIFTYYLFELPLNKKIKKNFN